MTKKDRLSQFERSDGDLDLVLNGCLDGVDCDRWVVLLSLARYGRVMLTANSTLRKAYFWCRVVELNERATQYVKVYHVFPPP